MIGPYGSCPTTGGCESSKPAGLDEPRPGAEPGSVVVGATDRLGLADCRSEVVGVAVAEGDRVTDAVGLSGFPIPHGPGRGVEEVADAVAVLLADAVVVVAVVALALAEVEV